ncbi:MAG: sigma-E processing peptidase SpoIIGA [Oscillospiraceae bacterium]|nr:sigma-E processing peptidase SpoIIGA [Oscillospiraceae bacterium]
MVIYADVLVAINYFVSYALLCGCSRIAGIPLNRKGKVRGALAGGLTALAVFLPLEGFVYGVLLRFVSAATMLLAAWPGRRAAVYLRLGIILLCISFLFAGGVMGVCLLDPKLPVFCPAGMIYFDVKPFTLLVSVTVCYLLLGLIKLFYAQNKHQELLYGAKVVRKGREISLRLFQDSGNRLVEPFSGLPVVVCALGAVLPLLAPQELSWFEQGMPPQQMPLGFRVVGYHAVGSRGILPAFRPEKFYLTCGEEELECDAWVAVNTEDMPGCDGVFNPAMLELRI